MFMQSELWVVFRCARTASPTKQAEWLAKTAAWRGSGETVGRRKLSQIGTTLLGTGGEGGKKNHSKSRSSSGPKPDPSSQRSQTKKRKEPAKKSKSQASPSVKIEAAAESSPPRKRRKPSAAICSSSSSSPKASSGEAHLSLFDAESKLESRQDSAKPRTKTKSTKSAKPRTMRQKSELKEDDKGKAKPTPTEPTRDEIEVQEPPAKKARKLRTLPEPASEHSPQLTNSSAFNAPSDPTRPPQSLSSFGRLPSLILMTGSDSKHWQPLRDQQFT